MHIADSLAGGQPRGITPQNISKHMSYKHTYKLNQLERGDVQTVIPQLCGCSISLSNN
jgi:hypothetical protein